MILLGAFLSIVSALSFSTNNALARRGMTGASASQGAFITVLLGVPLFLVAALVSGQLFRAGDIPLNGYLLLAIAGILHFGVGRYCNYRAIGAVGSARSQPIQTMTIPYSIFIAWLFLGETIDLLMAIGILLIMIGPAVIIERSSRLPAAPPRGAAQASGVKGAPPFQLRQVEGYSFALLAALCYGSSPIFIRAALEGQAGVSILGGTVSYIAAGLFVLLPMLLPGRRSMMRAINLRTFRLFFAAGFFVFFAQMLRFIALALAPVAIVSPLQRLAALFTLFIAATINRDIERINRKVVIGVIISLAGSVLLVFGGVR